MLGAHCSPHGTRTHRIHLCYLRSRQMHAAPGLPLPEVLTFLCLPRCIFIDLPSLLCSLLECK